MNIPDSGLISLNTVLQGNFFLAVPLNTHAGNRKAQGRVVAGRVERGRKGQKVWKVKLWQT